MIFLILVLLSVFAIVIVFSFPKLSPIPYFPTNKKDIPLIVKTLGLRNDQTVIDLGAGDGIVIFAAAQEALKKKLNTKFMAIELNLILVLIMHLRRIFHPNRKNIRIVHDNIFSMNYSKLSTLNFKHLTFYMYISPWHMEKVISNLIRQLADQNFQVVSYYYPLPKTTKGKAAKILAGKNPVFVYKIL